MQTMHIAEGNHKERRQGGGVKKEILRLRFQSFIICTAKDGRS